MKILAIETSTEACSAALLTDATEKKIVSRFELAPREHTKLILPMMDEVLDEAGVSLKELDAIAFGRGPGAFTGLRIASGIAQGIALSVEKPVVPVSTLHALALQGHQLAQKENLFSTRIITALDARMGEVYWGEFGVQNGLINLIGDEKVTQPTEMLTATQLDSSNDLVVAIGTGWDAYQQELFESKTPENICFLQKKLPSAIAIAELASLMLSEGKAVPPEEAQPVYIRNKIAKKSIKLNS